MFTYIFSDMKSIGKNFTTRAIENAIINYSGIKVQQHINDTPRQVRGFHYCYSHPTKRPNPQLIAISPKLLQQLGYDLKQVMQDQNTPQYLSGTILMKDSKPIAHNYCGFQFGVWAGQLGDGRAHTLGTIKEGDKIYELQLKGSGLSPFSRHADGNSVVSSAVREFLASELMHGLHIPTTRALSLVFSDKLVARDPFYNGKIKMEKAAVVLRVCGSFLRFGSFQLAIQNQIKVENPQQRMKLLATKRQYLSAMADYVIQNFYSHLKEGQYSQLFKDLVIRSAKLVAAWQSIGFVHGVLNTDNMSMLGVTIDYGPFGFIDYFSKDYVSNLTDQHQRYSYRRQPFTVKWNLYKLAEAMDFLVPYDILQQHIVDNFDQTYQKCYNERMSEKLGLENNEHCQKLVEQLLQIMHICGSNFTNTFKKIAESNGEDISQKLIQQSLPKQMYIQRVGILEQKHFPQEIIKKICIQDTGFNPSFLRQQPQRRLMLDKLMKQSNQQRKERETNLWKHWLNKYNEAKPDYEKMRKNTIQYVLLNETAKNITEQLNSLNIEEQQKLMQDVLDVFQHPYEKNQWFEKRYWNRKPIPVRLTCSS